MNPRHSFIGETDLLKMRSLLQQPGIELGRVEFDELIVLESIQENLRIWRNPAELLIAFAFVDDFNNLCFAWDDKYISAALEAELVDWGITHIRLRNAETIEKATLDASCTADNQTRLTFLEKHGFVKGEVRTLYYGRNLNAPIPQPDLPDGFSLRSVEGEQQAERLAALHRAAFGTGQMTLEYRLAIMRVDGYDSSLDLFIEASGGEPVAFCVCSIAEEENARDGRKSGYTDPVGVDPQYQGQGFGKAILSAGLQALKNRGMECAKLGTSSENISMQRLAEAVGFQVVSEKIWFSKIVA